MHNSTGEFKNLHDALFCFYHALLPFKSLSLHSQPFALHGSNAPRPTPVMEDEAPGMVFNIGCLKFLPSTRISYFLLSVTCPYTLRLLVFHAKPVSKRMMEAPVGVPPKKAAVLIGKETLTHFCKCGRELTYITCEEPQSPAFALKSRMAERNLQKAPMPDPEPVSI